MPTLALIAHDNKKVDLVAWATYNRDVEALLSGAEGGDAQIAARVATR
jgi:methylglyoxal synthase